MVHRANSALRQALSCNVPPNRILRVLYWLWRRRHRNRAFWAASSHQTARWGGRSPWETRL